MSQNFRYRHQRLGPVCDPVLLPGHRTGAGAHRQEPLPVGTYTVEVVASSPGNGGHLDLVLTDMPPKYTPSEDCRIDLGDITYVGTWSDRHSEAWGASGCGTFSRTGAYARFFRFKLTQTVKLTFALDGGPDSRIYLYNGASFRDSDLIEDDLSFIERNLAPGTYTVEVTTLYGDGRSDDEYTFAYRRTGPRPPDPDPVDATSWSATLTLRENDGLGCRGAGSCRTALAIHAGSTGSGNRFALANTWYTIYAIRHRDSDGDGDGESDGFTFQTDKALGRARTLTIATDEQFNNVTHRFTLSDHAGAISWGGQTMDWAAGDKIYLKIE